MLLPAFEGRRYRRERLGRLYSLLLEPGDSPALQVMLMTQNRGPDHQLGKRIY